MFLKPKLAANFLEEASCDLSKFSYRVSNSK
jgi:hypothetical protein